MEIVTIIIVVFFALVSVYSLIRTYVIDKELDEVGKCMDCAYLVAISTCEELEKHRDMLNAIQGTKEVSEKMAEKHAQYAELRKTMNVKSAGEQLGVSYTTAKRYERWLKENK
jgi:hypothetical protein